MPKRPRTTICGRSLPGSPPRRAEGPGGFAGSDRPALPATAIRRGTRCRNGSVSLDPKDAPDARGAAPNYLNHQGEQAKAVASFLKLLPWTRMQST